MIAYTCILNPRNTSSPPLPRPGDPWGSATMAKLTNRLKLGRSKDCSITLRDTTISRTHAAIEINRDGTLDIQDLGSANGTWVKRKGRWRRVDRVTMRADQEIRFGKKKVLLSELFKDIDLVALVGARRAAALERLDSGAIDVHNIDQREWHERPRRNPDTGDIEEKP